MHWLLWLCLAWIALSFTAAALFGYLEGRRQARRYALGPLPGGVSAHRHGRNAARRGG